MISIVFLTRSVSQPVDKVVAMLKDIASGKGDLTKRLTIESNDEIGELANWFNLFVDKLHDIIAQVKTNTEMIDKTTSEVSSTATQLAITQQPTTATAGQTA